MGQCQDWFTGWHSMSDIVTFALTLKAENSSAFLIVVSALCWSMWKHWNAICLFIRNDCENDKEFSVTNYIPCALLARSC